MSHPGHAALPSSSLPPVRSLLAAPEERIHSALRNLHAIYCPLRLPTVIAQQQPKSTLTVPQPVDSGYASEDEGDDQHDPDGQDTLEALRADVFEREFVVRWLTTLIARVDEMPFSSDEIRERVMDDAGALLASFSDSEDPGVSEAIMREFAFPMSSAPPKNIHVLLNDAPLSGTDHTDVGLQSWGASIILSGLMCASPARFGLVDMPLGTTIVELGAGTGLVSLTLAALQPHVSAAAPTIIATDYHPAVLENLSANITANFASSATPPIRTELLDWAVPRVPETLADILIAADAVYAPEHAALLRGCAARLLASDGVFWLIVTVRNHGKFEGIAETVEAAFSDGRCPMGGNGTRLKILGKEWLDKQKGVGRGDETGYNLYRIGWA